MLAVSHYLATKPDGIVLVCLIVSIVCSVVMGVVAFMEKAFPLLLLAGVLAFFVLAFLV